MFTLTKDNFVDTVKAHKAMIIDFWSPTCGPCKTLEPLFDKLSKEYDGRLSFAKLNIAENEGTAQQFEIFGLPCLVIFNNGAEIARIEGNYPEASLRRKIDAALAQVA